MSVRRQEVCKGAAFCKSGLRLPVELNAAVLIREYMILRLYASCSDNEIMLRKSRF